MARVVEAFQIQFHALLFMLQFYLHSAWKVVCVLDEVLNRTRRTGARWVCVCVLFSACSWEGGSREVGRVKSLPARSLARRDVNCTRKIMSPNGQKKKKKKKKKKNQQNKMLH